MAAMDVYYNIVRRFITLHEYQKKSGVFLRHVPYEKEADFIWNYMYHELFHLHQLEDARLFSSYVQLSHTKHTAASINANIIYGYSP